MSSVSYSPEDNKIRLYVGRVPRAEYEELRAAGFVSTPKQSCDFVATWTPTREDLARQYLEDGEDIDDEDYSPEERAADRAERFDGYREKREGEAIGAADRYDAGPSAFGHQSRARAERQARRHDRNRTYAVSQWSKAEYWLERTAAVIAHARFKSSAHVRRGRLLGLEAEQRKQQKSIDEYRAKYEAWQRVLTLAGSDRCVVRSGDMWGIDKDATSDAGRLAYAVANVCSGWDRFTHPRTGKENRSTYDLLTDVDDPCTPEEVANLFLAECRSPDDPSSWSARWLNHFAMRIEYEKAMLANEGGIVSEQDIIPGGWIRINSRRSLTRVVSDADGWAQVLRVFHSPATGRVTSVQLLGSDPFGNDSKVKPRTLNIERLGEGCYRPPTDEELAEFNAAQKETKAAEKAAKPKAAPTINPTDEDAEKLQAIWNEQAKDAHDRSELKSYGRIFTPYKPSEVRRMTQDQYSAASKGSYAHCTIHAVKEHCGDSWRGRSRGRLEVFKVRRCSCSGFSYGADRVIILTDKPQKPIPWAEIEAAKNEQPSVEKLTPFLPRIYVLATATQQPAAGTEDAKLFSDAEYIGWIESSSWTQFHMTEAGFAAYQAHQAAKSEAVTV